MPIIKGCDVLEESENTVIREAHFEAAMGNPAKTVREVCKSYPMSKVSHTRTKRNGGEVLTWSALGRFLAARRSTNHEHCI